MATTNSPVSVKHLLLLLLALCLSTLPANSIDFEVGGDGHWDVPPEDKNRPGTSTVYNDWASRHRFQVGDTIRFVYQENSLMVVGEGEYNQCIVNNPVLPANGTTTYLFDKPGHFYFISGDKGNCYSGLNMAIEVKEELSPRPAHSACALTSAPPPLLVLLVAVGNVVALVLAF